MKKKDLIEFEKNLLKIINISNGTKYNYKNLAEWNSSRDIVKKNLRGEEIIYEALGVFVAISPKV